MIEPKEKIQCSAILYDNNIKYPHQPNNIKTGVVTCGLRHCNCVVARSLMNLETKMDDEKEVQGFLTNKNRFVDRFEALEIATNANQIKNKKHNPKDQLTSEDIY